MKRRKKSSRTILPEVEIDMAPMLALMVTLIPILLLSSTFVHLRVIDSGLPSAGSGRKPASMETQVQIAIKSNKSVEVKITGKVTKNVTIPAQNQIIDTGKLNEQLSSIKPLVSTIFTARLVPDRKVSYDEIVAVIDAVRKSKSQKFTVTRGEIQAETDLLFPNISFGSL